MHSMLDVPLPKLARLEHGLTAKDRRERWKAWRENGIEGVEVTVLGGAYGPTWPRGVAHSLDFLKDFPGISALNIVVSELSSLEPLTSVRDSLEWLGICGCEEQLTASCQPVAACRKLRSLSLARLPKDLHVIEALSSLEALHLLGFTLKSLDVVQPLKNLERLWIGFGSMPDIVPVADLPHLKAVELMRVRKVGDLAPLSAVKTLQFLGLGDMKQIAAMPEASRLHALRRVYLDTMNGVTDVSGLTKAPNLEDLVVVNSKIAPEVFDPIIASPRPRRVTLDLASRKATAAVEARLGPRATNVFGTTDEKIVLK